MNIVVYCAFVGTMLLYTSDVVAQTSIKSVRSNKPSFDNTVPTPRKNVRPYAPNGGAVLSYDASSTVLTVKFPSDGGSVTVMHNGLQVASMSSGSSTTFRSELRQYGTGDYKVTVSNGNTVIENKNFTVR